MFKMNGSQHLPLDIYFALATAVSVAAASIAKAQLVLYRVTSPASRGFGRIAVSRAERARPR
jgi:hypothetical protein